MDPSNFPRQGDVYWVTLDPIVGSEMNKTRPCVIVTKNLINQNRKTVVIIPLSSTSPKRFPLYVPTPSMGPHSQAVIDQIRVVDKDRVGRFAGALNMREMDEIAEAIINIFGL